ncbi:MAG: lipid A hydroxylase LpxO, partial [Burkholderiaceae bacterium]
NRLFAKYVMAAASSQNVEGESIGGLNVFFYYGYKVRMQGKRLKAYSRSLYYVVKWALIFGLLWLIFW